MIHEKYEVRYDVLSEVLLSIADDYSGDNIKKQTARLTTVERRHIRSLMAMIEQNLVDLEYTEMFGDENGNN